MAIPANIDDSLLREANRIVGIAAKRMSTRSPWSTLMPKAIFEPGKGVVHTSVLYERSGFTTNNSWTNVGLNAGSTNSCVPPADIIDLAYTTYTHQLQQRAFESIPFCWNDLYTAWDAKDQVSWIMKQFADRIVDEWEERDRQAYTNLAKHKVVFVDGELTEDDDAFPLVVPTGRISNEQLAYIYNRLCQDGADEEAEVGKQDGAPVFLTFLSQEQSAALAHQGEYRNDIRWSDKANDLLKPFAITRVINGFAQKIDVKAPRWDFVSNAWVRRPFYVNAAATSGTKLEVNPAYLNAEFEDIHIFLRNVVERQVPQAIRAFGPATFGDMRDFIGNINWVNKYDHERNPDMNIGFFRAVLQASYRPLNPNLGYVIRVKRCPDQIGENPCPEITPAT